MTLAQRNSTFDTFDPQRFDVMCRMAETFIRSRMLPSSIQTPEQAILIMVKGQELGLQPLQALNGINVIQGKPTVSPQLMLALINASGELEDIRYDLQPDHVTCTMKRRGKTEHSERFGSKEAQLMGLSGKDNYKKQPQTMYKWRATAAVARVCFPDVIDGLYTPEEMGADVVVDQEGGMTIVAESVPAAPAAHSAQPFDAAHYRNTYFAITQNTPYAGEGRKKLISTVAGTTDSLSEVLKRQDHTLAQKVLDTAEAWVKAYWEGQNKCLSVELAQRLETKLKTLGVKDVVGFANFALQREDIQHLTGITVGESKDVIAAAEKVAADLAAEQAGDPGQQAFDALPSLQ